MSKVLTARIEYEDGCPSEQEVRQELSTLLAHGEFHASERNRRFLTYIVEETLQGRAERIKAYSIAIAAFDRSDDFDPLTDPIVRIEASRLRRSLEHYYLTAGKSDPVVIDMPKGSYVATFRYADAAAAAEHHAPAPAEETPAAHPKVLPPDARPTGPAAKRGRNPWIWAAAAALGAVVAIQAAVYAWNRSDPAGTAAAMRGPSLVVLPFENVGADRNLDFVARGLTFEIINSLTRFSDLFVFGPDSSLAASRLGARGMTVDTARANYILSGSVYSTDEAVRVSAILVDARSNRSVWSANLDRSLSTADLLSIQSDIAEQVATAIGRPYGAVFSLTADEIAAKPAASLRSYECVVRFRQRWREYDPSEYDDMRACLEQTIKADPGYARAYASLALLDMDAVRFGFGQGQTMVDPLREAMDYSKRALDMDPGETDAYLALSMAYWFSGDFDASIGAARRGLLIDPNNTDLMAELGFRYAFQEKWDMSQPLIAEAFARNPALPSGYRIANFQFHYMHGDYQAAAREALQIKARYVVYGYLALAAAYGQLGDQPKAAAALTELLKIDPRYGERVEADLLRRGTSEHMTRALIDGLVKAGLQVPKATGG
jgi:TolB-like protein/Tfp pilus assembly protein PilF